MNSFINKRMVSMMLFLLLIFLVSGLRAGEMNAGEEKTEEYKKEEPEQTEKRVLYRKVVADMGKHFEPSYMTATGGYNVDGPMRMGDIYYEAQMYVHYNWYDSSRRQDQEVENHIFLLNLPIRFTVRQYRQDSSPVKTPSYNPGFRVYYLNRSWINSAEDFHYASLGFHHYSNGQNGAHYNPDGTINTDNGSFSSEYVEASYYRNMQTFWWKANYRQYLVWREHMTWEAPQTHYYERALAELSGRYYFEFDRAHPSLQVTVGYKLGRDYVASGQDAAWQDNLQYTTEVFLPVHGWSDIQLYLRWDKGYDYYNINYQNRMNRVQFGISAMNF